MNIPMKNMYFLEGRYRKIIDPKIYIFNKAIFFVLFGTNLVVIIIQYLKKNEVLRYQKFLVQLTI